MPRRQHSLFKTGRAFDVVVRTSRQHTAKLEVLALNMRWLDNLSLGVAATWYHVAILNP